MARQSREHTASGVNTPNAAAVALATAGFAILVHMPKGRMFTMGTLSMMFAAGMFPAMVRLTGRTMSVDGGAAKRLRGRVIWIWSLVS